MEDFPQNIHVVQIIENLLATNWQYNKIKSLGTWWEHKGIIFIWEHQTLTPPKKKSHFHPTPLPTKGKEIDAYSLVIDGEGFIFLIMLVINFGLG